MFIGGDLGWILGGGGGDLGGWGGGGWVGG
jgi:hypothetical protein